MAVCSTKQSIKPEAMAHRRNEILNIHLIGRVMADNDQPIGLWHLPGHGQKVKFYLASMLLASLHAKQLKTYGVL